MESLGHVLRLFLMTATVCAASGCTFRVGAPELVRRGDSPLGDSTSGGAVGDSAGSSGDTWRGPGGDSAFGDARGGVGDTLAGDTHTVRGDSGGDAAAVPVVGSEHCDFGDLDTICTIFRNKQIDGDLTLSGTGSLWISAGATVSVVGTERTLHIELGGGLTIAAGGALHADGAGHQGVVGCTAGVGPGAAPMDICSAAGGGGGHGGHGAAGATLTNVGGATHGVDAAPASFGSSGAAGSDALAKSGSGGGAIRILVGGTVVVDGTLSSGGLDGVEGSGGGAGGALWITSSGLEGVGEIRAVGGAGAGSTSPFDRDAGSGGGGRIAFEIGTAYRFSGRVSVLGGAGPSPAGQGERGSFHLALAQPDVLCDLGSAGDLCVLLGSRSIGDTFNFDIPGDLILSSGASLRTVGRESMLHLRIAGDLSLLQGASIDVSGTGFSGHGSCEPGGGPEGGTITNCAKGGGGGGHGGHGGAGQEAANLGAPARAREFPPALPGSGGASGNGTGGDGGGWLHLQVGGVTTIDGEVRADGATGSVHGGGGSGGALWLETAELTGSGVLSASGGLAGGSTSVFDSDGGGGGGGVIFVEVASAYNWHGTISVGGALAVHRGGSAEEGRFRLALGSPDAICTSGTLATLCNIASTLYLGAGHQVVAAGDLMLSDGALIRALGHEADLTFTVQGDFALAVGSAIDVDATGHRGRGACQAGVGTGAGAITVCDRGGAGGGHGGEGGYGQGTSNVGGAIYGDVISPVTLGSGGSSGLGGGGHGGGSLRFSVDGTLTVDGDISAIGGAATGLGGGGGGGSIWINAAVLAGSGTIRADGGHAGSSTSVFDSDGGGGGGGLIAVHITGSHAFGGDISVSGGAALHQGSRGDHGQYYLGAASPDAVCTSGSLDTVCTVDGNLHVGREQAITGVGTLVVESGAAIRALGSAVRFSVDMGTDVVVKAGGEVSADLSGYDGRGSCLSGIGPGAVNLVACGSGGGGAGHGGLGSAGQGGVNPGGAAYGATLPPLTTLGSGGGGFIGDGGNGGGAVHLVAGGTMTVDGRVAANGGVGTGESGGGAGGSVWLEAGLLDGAGTIEAKGGRGGGTSSIFDSDAGGGSGGRIALEVATAYGFIGTISVDGGGGDFSAGGGRRGSYALIPGTPDAVCTSGTLDTTCVIDAQLYVGAGFAFLGSGDLQLRPNASILTAAEEAGFSLDFAGDITIPATATLRADGAGHAGGRSCSPGDGVGGGLMPACDAGAAGGGHGGVGGAGRSAANQGGVTYGLANAPVEYGSGGSASGAKGGNGGGAIEVIAAGTLVLDGTISANGTAAVAFDAGGGGGAGGSVWIDADTFTGTGVVQASGGAGAGTTSIFDDDGGGGGGGRIYVTYTVSTFSGTGVLDVGGGSAAPGAVAGSPGTAVEVVK